MTSPSRLRRLPWFVSAAALVACGGATPPTTAPAPSTQPAVVRLADAKPLAELTPGDKQVANLTDKLSPPQSVDRAVYFGEVDEYDSTDEDAKLLSSLPVVAVKDGEDWKAVPLVGRGLADAGWRYVGAGPRPGEIWGVLDTSAGDSGPDFVLAHSTDGGQTFALATTRKVCPQASVSDFAMDRSGRGRVTLSLDETVGRHKPGLYVYETADGGATWSPKPRFEPDAMVRAESVPDDEQPDSSVDGGKKGKTAWRGRRPIVTLRAVDSRVGSGESKVGSR